MGPPRELSVCREMRFKDSSEVQQLKSLELPAKETEKRMANEMRRLLGEWCPQSQGKKVFQEGEPDPQRSLLTDL